MFAWGQSVTDSVYRDSTDRLIQQRQADSLVRARYLADSLADKNAIRKSLEVSSLIKQHPYLPLLKPPVKLDFELRTKKSDDLVFYLLCFLVFYFAMVRLLFDRYFSNLLTLFFRVTMRQQQIRDQLLQSPLPSLLLNILFVLTGGLYLSFLALHYRVGQEEGFWWIYLYCLGIVAGVYLVKFLFLKIMGWIFNVKVATDTYLFIVFLNNKMIGIFLIPILFMIAFPYPGMYEIAIGLSYMLIGVLYLYRFLISYMPVRAEIKVNKFHFFLYLCAFEIAPLLLIYKVLLSLVETST